MIQLVKYSKQPVSPSILNPENGNNPRQLRSLRAGDRLCVVLCAEARHRRRFGDCLKTRFQFSLRSNRRHQHHPLPPPCAARRSFDGSNAPCLLNHLHGYITNGFGHPGSLWAGMNDCEDDDDDDDVLEEDAMTMVTIGRAHCANVKDAREGEKQLLNVGETNVLAAELWKPFRSPCSRFQHTGCLTGPVIGYSSQTASPWMCSGWQCELQCFGG
ncbi:hypothetical protein Q8A73_010272 [Channa argus]|nr:hypothetical protein Q8A73_010272 [Channa argus]